MSRSIEWAELTHASAELRAEGEITDAYGTQNDLPALEIGECVIEGTPEQWHGFALRLLDSAAELIADEHDELEKPPHMGDLIEEAKDALRLWGEDADEGDALASAMRRLLLALSPEGLGE